MKLYALNGDPNSQCFIMMGTKVVEFYNHYRTLDNLEQLISFIQKPYLIARAEKDQYYEFKCLGEDFEMIFEFSDIKDLINLKTTNPELFI